VTDAEGLAESAAGADWFCSGCESANPGNQDTCKRCGAPRGDASPAPVATEPLEPELEAPVSPAGGKLRRIGLAVGVLVAICGGVVFWASMTQEMNGEVSAVSWERDVLRQTFTATATHGWQDELTVREPVMPVNGEGEDGGVQNIRECHEAQRGTIQVEDGQEEVCTTMTQSVVCGTTESCTVTDLGNGFAEEVCTDVTQYCDESHQDCHLETRYRDEPVYDTQCSYDTYAWKDQEVTEAAGNDSSPEWPSVETDALDRLVRSAEYLVKVGYDENTPSSRAEKSWHLTHQIAPETEEEFLRWPIGEAVVVTVNNLGEVEQALLAPEVPAEP
jgi:hypothetical protein